MTAIEIGSLILAGEFGLLAWAILFFLLRQHRNIKHADHHHAGAVLEELEQGEIDRRDALQTLFAETYRLEGDELSDKVDEYIDREKAFYSAMLSLYLERDGEKLKEMPAELTKVLAPWTHMTPTGMVHATEIGNLEEEKAALATELQSTKQTLEDLMDEYMAAFDKTKGHAETQVEEQLPEDLAPEMTPDPVLEETAEITFDEPAEEIPPEPEAPVDEAPPDETDPTAGIEFDAPPSAPPSKKAAPEEETDDTAELSFDEPTSAPAEEPTEQIDPLQEQEDLDDVSLSALGIEPEPETEEQAEADDVEPGSLKDDLFEPPDSPDQLERSIQPRPAEEFAPAEEDLEDALAREELEGLADLFDPPSDKP